MKIGFTDTQATYVLPHFLPDFAKKYPQIEIELVEASSDEIEIMVLKDEADLGIIHPPIEHEEPYLDIEFLRSEPLVLTKESQRSRKVVNKILQKANIIPNIRQTSKNLSALDALVSVNYASDVMITINPNPERGIKIYLQSSVKETFGDAIEKTVRDVLSEFDVKNASLESNDKGALDFTIRARTECAVCRDCGISYDWSKGDKKHD